jgi:hypothetical protein
MKVAWGSKLRQLDCALNAQLEQDHAEREEQERPVKDEQETRVEQKTRVVQHPQTRGGLQHRIVWEGFLHQNGRRRGQEKRIEQVRIVAARC